MLIINKQLSAREMAQCFIALVGLRLQDSTASIYNGSSEVFSTPSSGVPRLSFDYSEDQTHRGAYTFTVIQGIQNKDNMQEECLTLKIK